MKFVTSIEGMKVDIYTDGNDVKIILSTPEGRWMDHAIASREFRKRRIFKKYMAEQTLRSYNERNT